jgi:hypothetical protein
MWSVTSARRIEGLENISFTAWALGYLSGLNQALHGFKKADMLQGVDAQALLSWLDNYCRANPLDNLGKALDGLTGDLVKRANIK